MAPRPPMPKRKKKPEPPTEEQMEEWRVKIKENWRLLKTAPLEVQEHPEICLQAALDHVEGVTVVSPKMFKDKKFVAEVAKTHGLALEYLPADVCKDRELVKSAVRQNWRALEHVDAEFLVDPEIAIIAARQDWWAVEMYIDMSHPIILKNEELWEEVARQNGEFALQVIKNGESADQSAVTSLRNDRELVTKAVTQNGLSLRFAGKHIRENHQVCLAAVAQDWTAFQYAAPVLRVDHKFILEAIKHSWEVLRLLAYEREAVVYASGTDGAVYRQVLRDMSTSSSWIRLSSKEVVGPVAVLNGVVYAVGVTVTGEDEEELSVVYKQDAAAMTLLSEWTKASMPGVTAIAIDSETQSIYGVDSGSRVVRQKDVNKMTEQTPWLRVSAPGVHNIAVSGGKVYGVGKDCAVYMQVLKEMSERTEWKKISKHRTKTNQGVQSIAVYDGYIYGVGRDDGMVLRQSLDEITPESRWTTFASGGVTSVAFQPPAGTVSDDDWIRIGKNRDIMLAAACQNIGAFEFVRGAFATDAKFMHEVVKKNGHALQFAPEEIRADNTIAHAAVKQSCWALLYTDSDARADRKIVLQAVKQDCWALILAAEGLRADREIVLAAVVQAKGVLCLVADALKEDPEVLELAGRDEKKKKKKKRPPTTAAKE